MATHPDEFTFAYSAHACYIGCENTLASSLSVFSKVQLTWKNRLDRLKVCTISLF